MAVTGAAGRIRRVSGPLVEATGLVGASMAELVELGPARLPAEAVAIRGPVVTLQAYEYTGGLRPGDVAVCQGEPLSAALGPDLLGGVFDGLLRPLSGAGEFLAAGRRADAEQDRRWHFLPAAKAGDEVLPGERLGTLAAAEPGGAGLGGLQGAVGSPGGAGSPGSAAEPNGAHGGSPGAAVGVAPGLEHRVLVPPGVRGRLDWVAADGFLGAADAVASVDGVPVGLRSTWPIRRPRPVLERLEGAVPLLTGQRVLDLLYPVARGSAAAVPGGFGTGKTMLLQQIAKWSDADVIVYVGCGERGNELADTLQELRELEDPRRGGRLADRTVILANTSNMPMMAREASIYSGLTVAEYFRDMGYDTVVIADSTSRWAEARREFASRTRQLPAEEGYPADLPSSLAAFYERAGRYRTLGGTEASVTVIGAVSPAGGDMTEPVTAHTQRFVRCLWTLDRDLAYARHYPAVTWRGSYSRDAPEIGAWYTAQGDPDWVRRRARLLAVLAEADRLAELAELVGVNALPAQERMVLLAGSMIRTAVLQQNAGSHSDATCGVAKQAALVDAVLAVHDRTASVVAAGVPAATVETVDFTPLLRAREDGGPDDIAAVAARAEQVLTVLDGLT